MPGLPHSVYALFRYRGLRTISNCLIGNLAASDFLLAVTVLPLSAATECLGFWAFGRVACSVWLVVDVVGLEQSLTLPGQSLGHFGAVV